MKEEYQINFKKYTEVDGSVIYVLNERTFKTEDEAKKFITALDQKDKVVSIIKKTITRIDLKDFI